MAQRSGFDYMECSAKSGEAVEAIFYQLALKMKRHIIDEEEKPGRI